MVHSKMSEKSYVRANILGLTLFKEKSGLLF